MAKEKDEVVKKSTEAVKKPDKNEKLKLTARIAQWFRDLSSELKKVVWPTKSQIVNNTLVALVVIVASAVVLWGFDSLAQLGVSSLVNLVG